MAKPKLPTINISVTLQLESAEQRLILEMSVERMINTTLRCLDELSKIAKSEGTQELVDTNKQDWNELRQLVCKLWNQTRNEIFVQHQKANTQS